MRSHQPLRTAIERLVAKTQPKQVACLGAGLLYGIPYRALVRGGALIHLVDHVSGDTERGIARSVIATGEDDRPECVYCTLNEELLAEQVERYCDEIARIMASDGYCFAAFELFQFDKEVRRWFLVRETHKALEMLAERFTFDYEVLATMKCWRRARRFHGSKSTARPRWCKCSRCNTNRIAAPGFTGTGPSAKIMVCLRIPWPTKTPSPPVYSSSATRFFPVGPRTRICSFWAGG